MDQIYVIGVGMTRFSKNPELSVKDLTRIAVEAALKDAGCKQEYIQAAYYTNTTQGHLENQNFIRGPIALRAMGFESIPMVTLENGCAAGSTALYMAINHIRAGVGDIALAVGTEKMNVQDKAKMFSVFESGWDVNAVEENKAQLLSLGEGLDVPPGTTSDKPYSIFMDVYAAFCRLHMKTFGTTQRQVAVVAAKNHNHSVNNPLCQYNKPFTVEEILKAPPITYPLTMPMCSPISDGGAAVIVCTEQAIKKYGFDRKRAIKVYSCILATGGNRPPERFDQHLMAITARNAYEEAGLGPDDMSVAEVHDATAFGEIIQTENLGFCKFGEGGMIAERGDTTIGGRIPVNPSGGLESKGHPIGATGLGQIHELVTQLRGEAGKRQVENPRFAIAENSGGLIGIEEAAGVITILGK